MTVSIRNLVTMGSFEMGMRGQGCLCELCSGEADEMSLVIYFNSDAERFMFVLESWINQLILPPIKNSKIIKVIFPQTRQINQKKYIKLSNNS